MFDGDDDLKQKLRDFLDDEIDEIKQNKIRFFALIFSFIISLSLLFTGDSDGEKIEVNNTAQIEENAEDTEKKDVENDENRDSSSTPVDGPIPEFYEPVESPTKNALHMNPNAQFSPCVIYPRIAFELKIYRKA